jgi:hypothetical protein
MPRRIGIELTAQVKNDVPTLRILIVTAQTEQQYAARPLKGRILKSTCRGIQPLGHDAE